MPLAAGTRLDSFEIVAPLGAGGMGEVYRARDATLKRDVAIKVLPEYWSRDTERLRRFEQEAQATAALNHPNIVSIFHVGQYDGSPYIVTELLQGETLRDRLRKGPMRQREVLDFGVELARGLSAAHDAGIVHRDLKPENIWVTKDGRIKILDFGLAKLDPAKAASSDGETVTVHPQSHPGHVVGTVGYMSPEQVRGQEVDHRSDIFSFGVILYELLSGHRAFQSDTAAETMAAILKQEPPDMPETVPYPVRQTVRHCLEKEPGNRFQSARDLSFALAAMSEATGRSGAALESAGNTALAPPHLDRRSGSCVDGARNSHLPAGIGAATANELVRSASGRTGNGLQTPCRARRPHGCLLCFGSRLHTGRRDDTRDRQLDHADS